MDNSSEFRCHHGIKAVHCGYCSPKRKRGKVSITLDHSGVGITAKRGMYNTHPTKQAFHIPEDIDKRMLDHPGFHKKRLRTIRLNHNLEMYLEGVAISDILKVLPYENS